jgi:hypothetical protein
MKDNSSRLSEDIKPECLFSIYVYTELIFSIVYEI